MQTLNLKSRIIIALVLIATLTSTLFAAGVLQIKQGLEAIIFEDMVAVQFEDLLVHLDQGDLTPHLFEGWSLYVGEQLSYAPHPIQQLLPGSHHSIFADERYYQVLAGEWRGKPVHLTFDITEWELQEQALFTLLAYGVGLVLIVTIGLGMSAAQAILSPVKRLSRDLSQIQPQQRGIRIAAEYQGTEIGQIAGAFDKYLERLDRFVERERSFTSAASHELRTPLSVILGATDVLSEQSASKPAFRALDRIRRACDEMLGFIEATLFLSREEATPLHDGHPTDIDQIVSALIETNQSHIDRKNLRIEKQCLYPLKVDQPASLVSITIGNILRNAIQHSQDALISIVINQHGVQIIDQGEGICREALPLIFDRSYTTKPGGTGLGLNLVKRICDRLHWRLDVMSEAGVGTSIRILFNDQAISWKAGAKIE
jgi:signal transduction histidine kinase